MISRVSKCATFAGCQHNWTASAGSSRSGWRRCGPGLDEYRAQQTALAEKRILMENIVEWTEKMGGSLDDLSDQGRREVLELLLDGVAIDGDNNVEITLLGAGAEIIPSPADIGTVGREIVDGRRTALQASEGS